MCVKKLAFKLLTCLHAAISDYHFAELDLFSQSLGAFAGNIVGSLWLKKKSDKGENNTSDITETEMWEHHKAFVQTN